jgi:hypothetical protein
MTQLNFSREVGNKFAILYNCLDKKENKRSKLELELVVRVAKDIPFFKDRKMTDQAIIEVLNTMTL